MRGAGRAWQIALAVVGVAAATGVSLLRQPGLSPLDTIYAEDGSVFLSDAHSKSTVDAVISPYAGYLHVVPRLLAELVSLLRLEHAAAGLAIAAAFGTGLLTVLVFVASGSVLTGRVARVLVSAVTVLVPVAQDELPNSIANLHWPGLYAIFWVLLWKPVGRLGRVTAILVVLLVTLSDLLAVVFIPMAILLWHKDREQHRGLLAAALGLGLGLQAFAMVSAPPGRPLGLDPFRWPGWWIVRAVPTGLLGERWYLSSAIERMVVLAPLAWLVIAGLLAVAGHSLRSLSRVDLVTRLAAVHCVAVYGLPVFLSAQAVPRYTAPSAMLLVTTLVLIVKDHRRAFAGLTVLCVLVWSANVRVPTRRGDGPSWIAEVARASAMACSDWAELAISPPGWRVRIPCRALRVSQPARDRDPAVQAGTTTPGSVMLDGVDLLRTRNEGHPPRGECPRYRVRGDPQGLGVAAGRWEAARGERHSPCDRVVRCGLILGGP